MGIFKKLFDLFVKEVHKIDQAAFLGKCQTSEQEDLGETQFEESIKEEQKRVDELKSRISELEEQLDEAIEGVPLKWLSSRQQPPLRYRAAVKLYSHLSQQIEELVSMLVIVQMLTTCRCLIQPCWLALILIAHVASTFKLDVSVS